MIGIPLYNDINDLHRLTGATLRTRDPLFHGFDMAETNNLTVSELPPHRANFYTLALNLNTQHLHYTLNRVEFDNPRYFILCVAPGQVVRWQKAGDWFGYCLFFKSEFLGVPTAVNFLQQYPFFNFNETNLIPVQPGKEEPLLTNFRQLLSEQATESAFSRPIMQATLHALLWQVRRIYEEREHLTPATKAYAIIAAQFQYLVNEHYLIRTTVDDYADLLHVTTNHLSQTIQAATGQPAKRFITQRRLAEARYLLQYTNNQVAEVAHHLGFSEPTHFIKFFRKETGTTPAAYRISVQPM